MLPAGFEAAVPTSERQQNYASDREAIGVKASLISLNKRKLCDYM
jgi:hypothetical protein